MTEQPTGTVRIRRTIIAEYDLPIYAFDGMDDEAIVAFESSEDQLAETFESIVDNIVDDTVTVVVKR